MEVGLPVIEGVMLLLAGIAEDEEVFEEARRGMRLTSFSLQKERKLSSTVF